MPEASVDPGLEAHLERLTELGWFEQYSEGDPRAVCRALFEDGVPAHWCVPSFLLDPECIYGEGDHTEVVRELVRSSHGLLGSPRVVETWGGDPAAWPFDAPISVEIHLESGKVLSASWVQESDVVSDAFANLLVDLVEAHGVVIEQVEPGQWIVGDPVMVDEVMRIGRREDRQERPRERSPAPRPTPSETDRPRDVPTSTTPEELRAWWLFRAGFFLAGHKMRTWKMLFGDEHGTFREAYLRTMNEAFDTLSADERRALVAREISEAGERLLPHEVAEALGMSIERLFELVAGAQGTLRQAGEALWAESAEVRASVE